MKKLVICTQVPWYDNKYIVKHCCEIMSLHTLALMAPVSMVTDDIHDFTTLLSSVWHRTMHVVPNEHLP